MKITDGKIKYEKDPVRQLEKASSLFNIVIEILSEIIKYRSDDEIFYNITSKLGHYFDAEKFLFVSREKDLYRIISHSDSSDNYSCREVSPCAGSLPGLVEEIDSSLIIQNLSSDERFDENEFFEMNKPQSVVVSNRFNSESGACFFIFYFDSKKPPVELRGVLSDLEKIIDIFEPHFSFVKKNLIEKDEMQKKIIRSSKLASIGTIAAGVAHEINNPLAIIHGNIDMIEDELASNNIDSFKKSISVIRKSIERIKNIVLGLRSYARVENKTVREFDVHSAIEDTEAIIEIIFMKCNIALKNEFKANKTRVTGSPGKFQQVVMNLFTNAKDAIGDRGGNIFIKTENIDDILKISISDDGPGIPVEDMEKIFESFYTTKEDGRGTGLGLSITRSIVEEMKGTIEVYSSPGKGTTFTINLRPWEESEKLLSYDEGSVKNFSASGLKVLVADDEVDIREILRVYLEGAGISVEESESGEEALDMFKKEKFDIVFTDLKMPGMSGEELLRKVREINDDVRFVAITGGTFSDLSEKEIENFKKNFEGYIEKPFSKQEIYKIIKKLVSSR